MTLLPLSLLVLVDLASAAAVAAPASLADISVPVADVLRASGPGGGGRNAPVSFWCCSMVQGKRSTLLFAQASVKQKLADSRGAITEGTVGITVLARSTDGETWSNMTAVPWSVAPQRAITYPSQAVSTLSGAVVVITTPGNDAHGYHPIGPNNTALSFITKSTDGKCSRSDPGFIESLESRSGADGLTWEELRPIPGVLGAGENHGIALRKTNPHAGRLVMPRIDDPFGGATNHSAVAFMLYSDDEGDSWRKGEALPLGWGEAAIAEMKNGSILWTSRLGPPYVCPGKPDQPVAPACRHYPTPVLRGMARSDDGGETIAETWLVEQDNVDGLLFGTCSSSLASDPRSGRVFWGHPGAWPPGNRTRSNYTVSSTADGKRWTFVDVAFPGGAGYSDLMVLPSGNLGVAFQRTLYESGVEGGGYDIAYASLKLAPQQRRANHK